MFNDLIEMTVDSSLTGRLSIGFADQVLIDSITNKPFYISAYGYQNNLLLLKRTNGKRIDANRPTYDNVRFQLNNYYRTAYNTPVCNESTVCTKTKLMKLPDSDYSQLLVYTSPDKFNSSSKSYSLFYIKLAPLVKFVREYHPEWTDEDIKQAFVSHTKSFSNLLTRHTGILDEIFRLVSSKTTIPFLEEWTYYCTNTARVIKVQLPTAIYADLDSEENVYAVTISYDEERLRTTISNGLRNHNISINNSNSVSETSDNINTLTDYLAVYSDQLIEKATNKFTPLFDPETDGFTRKEQDFFDIAAYKGKLNYYNAQRNVIGAVNRALDKDRSAIIVGECGSGKSALSLGSIYANSKSKNYCTLIMAPGHLVEKWKRETERLIPGARVEILSDFSDLMRLEPVIKDRSRNYPLYLVISKDTAKISYVERPAVIWDAERNVFRCPHCGATQRYPHAPALYRNSIDMTHYTFSGSPAYRETKYSVVNAIFMFNSKGSWNTTCNSNYRLRSTTKGTNPDLGKHVYSCNHTLWTCTNSGDESPWIRHTSAGYIHRDMMQPYKEYYEQASVEFKENPQHKKMYKAIIDIEENGLPRSVAPRRYSIARYMRQHLKGYIDYFVADEVHLYSSGTSAQGCAFGDFVRVANKTLALTGTLLNGYSTGMLPLLFRLYSRSFKNKGFNYNSESAFADVYGVKREVEVTNPDGRKIKGSYRVLPGVSPALFCDFLLDRAVFISLEDMSSGLPSYTEVPVAVTMDSVVREQYDQIAEGLKQILSVPNNENRAIAFQGAQKLSMYPDMPYCIAPILNRTNQPVLYFPDAVTDAKNYVSNKDIKCMEIVQEKLNKGENVLIFMNYVNKTDCVDRLADILEKAGISYAVLDSKVKANDREKWIDTKVKEGIRVLITSPALVETGLDLLAFTNIVFYQVGFNLFTLRQASRRSRRLNQPNPCTVYFLYFEDSAQEVVLSLMANKLQAAMAIEGKFTEEGLNAMSNNDDILTQVADSLVKNIEHKVEEGAFATGVGRPEDDDGSRFKLVHMIDERAVSSDKPLFISNKRKTRYSLDTAYAEMLALCEAS